MVNLIPNGSLLYDASLTCKPATCNLDPVTESDVKMQIDNKLLVQNLIKMMKNHSAVDARWYKVISHDANYNLNQLIGLDNKLLQSMLHVLGLMKHKGTNLTSQRLKFEEWSSKHKISASIEQVKPKNSNRKWCVRLSRFKDDTHSAHNQPKQTIDEQLVKKGTDFSTFIAFQ